MKRFLFIIFVISCFSAYSQRINVDINENTQNITLVSSQNLSANFSDHFNGKKNFVNENYQIPAFNLYHNEWDTLHIRSQKLEIPFFDNLIKIILVQENNSPFVFPCAGELALKYGNQRDRKFHTGIDYILEQGDPIVCCFDGVVRMVRKYGDYGNCIVIRHYNGLETIYAHLEETFVKPGQIVKAGNLIGNAGLSGNTDLCILHLEMRFMNEFFDPEKVIDNSTRRLKTNILELTPEDFYILPLPTKKNNQLEKNEEKDEEIINTNSPNSVYHIVKRGETLYKISRIYNVSINQIISLNNLKNNGENIQAGQKLKIK